jgi:tetratricopeptide (TPR) repeat protein
VSFLKYASVPVYLVFGLYGLAMLASHWASGKEVKHDHRFMFLGLAVPTAAWALTFFVPYASLALPAALFYLYKRMSEEHRHERAVVRSLIEEDLAAAQEAIAADPANAAAFFAKAAALERLRDRSSALEHYERAHALSDRTLTRSELNDIRDRLTSPPPEAFRRPSLLSDRFELAGVLIGLAMIPLNWVLGVDLFALMSFVAWYRRHDDPGAGGL